MGTEANWEPLSHLEGTMTTWLKPKVSMWQECGPSWLSSVSKEARSFYIYVKCLDFETIADQKSTSVAYPGGRLPFVVSPRSKCLHMGFREPQISGKADCSSKTGCWTSRLGLEVFCVCQTNGIFIFRFLRRSYFRVSSLLFLNLAVPPSYLCWAWASFLHSGAKIRSKYW